MVLVKIFFGEWNAKLSNGKKVAPKKDTSTRSAIKNLQDFSKSYLVACLKDFFNVRSQTS